MKYKITLKKTIAAVSDDKLVKIIDGVEDVSCLPPFVWFTDSAKNTLLLVQAGEVMMVERVWS